MIASGETLERSEKETMVSPDFNPAIWAGELGTTSVMTVCELVMGREKPSGVGIPIIKPREIRNQAKIKFPTTPETSTAD